MIKENMQVDAFLNRVLLEDIGIGDITTDAVVPESHMSTACIFAKGTFVIAGLPFVRRVFEVMDPGISFKMRRKDGDTAKSGEVILRLKGRTRGLLHGERTALNILQRLSGIATLTRMYVDLLEGLKVKIADTRKTTPGFRYFEKYAVKVGGGHNHRYGLFDGILIKDNHIPASGGIEKACRRARRYVHHLVRIEVEAKNTGEVRSALSAGADVIMLDNMTVHMMKESVKLIRRERPGVIIEASGNIDLKNARRIAETGVDVISVGALTHSAPSVDTSMEIRPLGRLR